MFNFAGSDCLPFVVLGLTTGVAKTCLNDGDDVSSGAIGILPGIPLGNRIQTVAYVSQYIHTVVLLKIRHL